MADAKYPKRKRFDAHRICRLLHKTCAAQEIGPLGAYLVTIIAHQEDSCRYRRPVTFYDGQLMPILGVTSQETLTTARRKAVAAGWLSYTPGHKGRASTYFVTIPEHVQGTEDGAIDEGSDSDSQDLRSEKSTESRSNPDRNPIDSRSIPDGKVPPFFPVPVPSPIPKEIPPQGAGEESQESKIPDAFTESHPYVDWISAEAQFLSLWNDSPRTSHRSAIPFELHREFRTVWLDDVWRDKFPAAIARLQTAEFWSGRVVSLKQFLDSSFVPDLLNGVYDGDRNGHGTAGGRRKRSERPVHLAIGEAPRDGRPDSF